MMSLALGILTLALELNSPTRTAGFKVRRECMEAHRLLEEMSTQDLMSDEVIAAGPADLMSDEVNDSDKEDGDLQT